MSNSFSGSDDSNSDSNELDPDFVPSRAHLVPIDPTNKPITRSRDKEKDNNLGTPNTLTLLDLSFNNTAELKNENMSTKPATTLSLETAINLIPKFNGEKSQDVYPFLNTCDFVTKTISEDCRPILLQAILTKLSGKAFAATQHREILSWEALKKLLEITFCAQRTPGYLQLELSTTRHKSGETVQEYSARVEKLLHELCNVSTSGRSLNDARAVHEYIKETTITTYIEGLPSTIRGVIKSKNHKVLEEAIKDSLEEDKIYQSSIGTQRLLNNRPSHNTNTKYCKNCRRNNHNTSECKYSSRRIDTGQSNKYSNENNNQTKYCAYCKKSGHIEAECYKKKNADTKKTKSDAQNLPSTSGNGKGPGATAIRPVRELKITAQEQEY